MRRLLAATAALLSLLPAATSAQERMSLWNLVSPDRLVTGAVHGLVAAVRTQVDLRYGDLSVDLHRARIAMTEIRLRPALDWDPAGACEVGIGRLALFAAPIDSVGQFRLKARLTGVAVDEACLPPPARQALEAAGLDGLHLPRLTLDSDYGIARSDLVVRVFADVEGLARIDASGDFDYVWVDGRGNIDPPEPVVILRRATLVLENDGAWAVLKATLPPPLTGSEAGLAVDAMLREMLQGMNAAGSPDTETALTPAQEAFVVSAAAVWPAFVADPQALVLETGNEDTVQLDFDEMQRDPSEAFALLQPQLALAPARVRALLPATLLGAALGEGAQDLTEAERRRAGVALLSGEGAPRNIRAGRALLEPLAQAGDGVAALALARVLEGREPENAYLWALRAGAAGQAGAPALLDRLERLLGLAEVLLLQDHVSGTDSHPGSALATVAGLRAQAARRLSGDGAARHYGIAAMWALMAKAAGDPEAADMLEEIDEIVRLEGAAARRAWAEVEARYAALATEVWIGQNLPARYRE